MSETKFTPGPWEISQEPPRWIIQSSGVPIGKKAVAFMVGDFIQCADNACLIAAAPDLYAALECFLTDERFRVAVYGDPVATADMWAKAYAALAKARGKT